MSKTSLLLIGTLALCGICVAGTKTYDITIFAAAKAGALELAPGKYKLKVEGGNAIFTEVESRQSFTAPIKIENGTRKYNYTGVDLAPEGKEQRIESIQLGGSTTQIDFE